MRSTMITIFTPTYNRRYILDKLYISLCNQTNKDFIWLVVDDGSEDETEQCINEWIKESIIKIRYVKQKNSGKHIAHNRGVLQCTTEMFMCVDSDDYLTENAVQIIYDNWNKVKHNEELAGIVALRGTNQLTPLASEMPLNIKISTIRDLYERYKFKGDTALIFKTKLLKLHLFPEFKDEKFVTESVIYDQISLHYEMYLMNEIIYVSNYLQDGYTMNIFKIHKRNPEGYLFYLKQRIDFSGNMKDMQKEYSYFIAGCFRIGKKYRISELENKYLLVRAIPKSIIIYLKPIIKRTLMRTKNMKGFSE